MKLVNVTELEKKGIYNIVEQSLIYLYRTLHSLFLAGVIQPVGNITAIARPVSRITSPLYGRPAI